MNTSPFIHSGSVAAYSVPTDAPEGDAASTWNSTTLIVVKLFCDDLEGIGYTYCHKVAAPLARDLIDKVVGGSNPFETNAIFTQMRLELRNYGEGIGAAALSAIDIAIWDLKAKLLHVPLVSLLGQQREAALVYGSGGFTTYDDRQLRDQMHGWMHNGITRMKMRIGARPDDDVRRAAVAREAIGMHGELFVDADGAYTRKQALSFAERLWHEYRVTWFEEPVRFDDVEGMRMVRDGAPAGMEIAAGEYGFSTMSLGRMLQANCVDVLQADATRCGGVTGFMEAAALADAHPLPLSAHGAPSVHLHMACAARPLRHIEFFHDHVRIERMLFDGFAEPVDGAMHPDLARPGLGLVFKQKDAEPFREDI